MWLCVCCAFHSISSFVSCCLLFSLFRLSLYSFPSCWSLCCVCVCLCVRLCFAYYSVPSPLGHCLSRHNVRRFSPFSNLCDILFQSRSLLGISREPSSSRQCFCVIALLAVQRRWCCSSLLSSRLVCLCFASSSHTFWIRSRKLHSSSHPRSLTWPLAVKRLNNSPKHSVSSSVCAGHCQYTHTHPHPSGRHTGTTVGWKKTASVCVCARGYV